MDQKRQAKYKTFSIAFSYPENGFFKIFHDLSSKKEKLIYEYDQLFRVQEIWLYGTEYLAENEFQKANLLSDIMGFYRAFGLEPNQERPDHLSSELEFMHYLIFKMQAAPEKEKADLCFDAQKKFFTEHLYPAATKITASIMNKAEGGFYKEMAEELIKFLDLEKEAYK